MGVIETQIAKAERRADFDVEALARSMGGKAPAQVASADAKRQRHDFLVASLGDAAQAERAFERIIGGNELQPVSYLERGAIAARAVARIAIRSSRGSGWGTGFLIAPQVLLTNNHVLADAATAQGSLAEFRYEIDLADRPLDPVRFELHPQRLFETSVGLDFTAVAVAPRSMTGAVAIESFGHLALLDTVGKAMEGEWLTIIQHPNGERKQVCVRENQLLKRDTDVLWYSTDTLAGSSGSPVFNNDWFVVALHHSGVPDKRGDAILTIDGGIYDPVRDDETRIKWKANEGIRASRIVDTLRARRPKDPLLKPMYDATPESARIQIPRALPIPRPVPTPPEARPMTTAFPIDVVVRIEADGSARVIGAPAGATEAALALPALQEARKPKPKPAAFNVPFDTDYSTRNGYDPNFLSPAKVKTDTGVVDVEVEVSLPELAPALKRDTAKLIGGGPGEDVLKYTNFSVVMNAKRRLAFFSAANVDCERRYDISRPEDTWRWDPRIRADHQLGGSYYERNNFDRGHLTRREDLEYGPTVIAALSSAADTCHWSNCAPQHSGFNQSKEIWQGIERYVLEDTIKRDGSKIRAQVFTGPVLDEGDPEYRGVQYPVQFWKVVVALDGEGRLSATAYLASQGEVIAQRGIEAAPFGAFGTFQVEVAEIERLTLLTFKGSEAGTWVNLRERDALALKRPNRRRPRSPQAAESAFASLPQSYRPLESIDDIVL